MTYFKYHIKRSAALENIWQIDDLILISDILERNNLTEWGGFIHWYAFKPYVSVTERERGVGPKGRICQRLALCGEP